jgi:hypothetical protein
VKGRRRRTLQISFDHRHHRRRRHHQGHRADRRQAGGLAGELGQVADDGVGDPARHQGLHKIIFQRDAK